MSATRTLRLDQLVAGNDAVVEIPLGADGTMADAWFAMDGMPRIEPLLVGLPVIDVPAIIERICGIRNGHARRRRHQQADLPGLPARRSGR